MLLKMVGERLLAVMCGGDLVARFGGDEFIILQTGGLRNPTAVAAQLVGCLRESFSIQGRDIRIGASLGFAASPRDGTDLDQLIAAADQALYEAKAAGRSTWRAASKRRQSGARAAWQHEPMVDRAAVGGSPPRE